MARRSMLADEKQQTLIGICISHRSGMRRYLCTDLRRIFRITRHQTSRTERASTLQRGSPPSPRNRKEKIRGTQQDTPGPVTITLSRAFRLSVSNQKSQISFIFEDLTTAAVYFRVFYAVEIQRRPYTTRSRL